MEKSRNCDVEAEIGRIIVEKGCGIVPKHQPKERIYSLCHRELTLMTGVSMSYHQGLDLLNRLLRRNPDNAMRFRTYRNFCQRAGEKAESYIAQDTKEVLTAHHFDGESGKPEAVERIDPEVREAAKPWEDEAAVHRAIEKINANRPMEDEQVKASATEIETPEQTCYISF